MAFIYTADGEEYENDFHFWYVNGFHPDPKLKEEAAEEKPKQTNEGGLPTVVSSWRRVGARARGWYR